MSKQIEITVGERDYILEYDRDGIKKMEAHGFSASEDFLSKPVTSMEMLFYGALLKNQPLTTRQSANKLFEAFTQEYNMGGFTEALVDMLREALPNAETDSAEKKTFKVIG